MFSSEGQKDSVSNIEETREFVCNFATWDLREQMNATSEHFPRDVDEMQRAGLEPAPSKIVKPPRVKAAPCALECKLINVTPLKDLAGRPLPAKIVVGQVVGVHIDERFLKNGTLDTAAMQPIMRCGYTDQYATIGKMFAMKRPD
jgi:flavin reductase (DIM6/NTAB) family NADH-FMN oxidoreductase RutF